MHCKRTSYLTLLINYLLKDTKLMSTLEELQTELAAISADYDAMLTAIQALKDQLAAGSPVTQEQLDALVAQAQSINDKFPQP